jgi:hypothetical protein
VRLRSGQGLEIIFHLPTTLAIVGEQALHGNARNVELQKKRKRERKKGSIRHMWTRLDTVGNMKNW